MDYINAKIVGGGMGGFLNPPTHPEHTRSVKFRRGSCSLTAALEDEYMSPALKNRIQSILDTWDCNRLPLSTPEMQEWIYQVLGYFRNCYRNPNIEESKQWNASQLIIDYSRNPMKNIDEHCGVHFIREYYPKFRPEKEHFDSAYWGKKPAPTS